jgi:hypothetical protein
MESLAAIPGVESVAATSSWPQAKIPPVKRSIMIEGQTPPKEIGEANKATTVVITPKFFETCKIALLHGRDFRWSDTNDSTPVVILDEREEGYWFGRDRVNPIGYRIKMLEGTGATKWREIVGIVKHVAYEKAGQQAERGPIYLPVSQEPQPFMWMALRTKSNPGGYEQPARGAVLGVNKDASIKDVKTLAEILP